MSVSSFWKVLHHQRGHSVSKKTLTKWIPRSISLSQFVGSSGGDHWQKCIYKLCQQCIQLLLFFTWMFEFQFHNHIQFELLKRFIVDVCFYSFTWKCIEKPRSGSIPMCKLQYFTQVRQIAEFRPIPSDSPQNLAYTYLVLGAKL